MSTEKHPAADPTGCVQPLRITHPTNQYVCRSARFACFDRQHQRFRKPRAGHCLCRPTSQPVQPARTRPRANLAVVGCHPDDATDVEGRMRSWVNVCGRSQSVLKTASLASAGVYSGRLSSISGLPIRTLPWSSAVLRQLGCQIGPVAELLTVGENFANALIAANVPLGGAGHDGP
jgi:hypothetical protein